MEVVFEDAAPPGGGIDTGVDLEGEARFVTEAGRWDGEPFEADQTLLLEVPEAIYHSAASVVPFRVDPEKQTGFMDPSGLLSKEDVERLSGKWVPPGHYLIVEP